jgi:flagellar biosynthesis chaperone FliJ
MMTIANPIYDTVFKYLMEDERIARTILSALLKENIVNVEVRPHEYTNGQKETLSIFRIDFGATVLKPNGEKQLILIELQKTWLPTETLRFRQYLGVHYQNPKNIVADSPDRHALPMVAVYLLGHTVGEIEDPVVYVRHEAFDYDDEPIVRGIPDKFIDSLNHDSIIVQIPRLHGRINNRLDKVLSIFDQSRVCHDNQHYLSVEDTAYETADSDMQPIIHRLLMAASNIEMRQNMNVEDEYYSIIKEQEGKVYGLERDLSEMKGQLKETSNQLTEANNQLKETSNQLTEANNQLKETSNQLTEANNQLTEANNQLTEANNQLTEANNQLTEANNQLTEKDGQLRTLVKMLLQAGQTVDDIAANLHIDKLAVQALA